MSTNTLDKQTVAKIASGTISQDELASMPVEDVFAAKSAGILQRRLGQIGIVKSDEDSRTITWAISDESTDRMGDVIRVAGWDLSEYEKNPVILWSHDQGMDHSIPAIGKALRTWKGEKRGGGAALMQEAEFAPGDIHPFADTIYQLAIRGFLNAVSVGFRPSEVYVPKSAEEREELKLGPRGVDFRKTELLENSVVNVPANPNALQNAMSDMVRRGIITDGTARMFVAEALEQEPGDWFGRAKSLVVDLEGIGERVRSIFEHTDESDASGDTAQDEPVSDEAGEESEEVLENPQDADVLTSTEGGEEDSEPAKSTEAEVVTTVVETVKSDPTPDYSLLVSALARMVEQQTEHTAAMRTLADALTDLARKVVSMSGEAAAPVAEPKSDSPDGHRTDIDEADLSAADKQARQLLESLKRMSAKS
jgi:hypothetical protein